MAGTAPQARPRERPVEEMVSCKARRSAAHDRRAVVVRAAPPRKTALARATRPRLRPGTTTTTSRALRLAPGPHGRDVPGAAGASVSRRPADVEETPVGVA